MFTRFTDKNTLGFSAERLQELKQSSYSYCFNSSCFRVRICVCFHSLGKLSITGLTCSLFLPSFILHFQTLCTTNRLTSYLVLVVLVSTRFTFISLESITLLPQRLSEPSSMLNLIIKFFIHITRTYIFLLLEERFRKMPVILSSEQATEIDCSLSGVVFVGFSVVFTVD